MKSLWALAGAIWGFLRIILLFFAIIIEQFMAGSPVENLLLLVFGSGSVGIITMYLELFRAPDSLKIIRNPLRWSITCLLVLGIACAILSVATNLRQTASPFGHGPSAESLVLLLLCVIGDICQFVILMLQKDSTPQPSEGAI